MSTENIALRRFHLGAACCLGLAVFAPALAVYERNAGGLAAGVVELIIPAVAAAAAVLAALLLSMVSRYRPFALRLILVAATSVMSAWFVFAGPVPPLDGWDRPFVVDQTRAVAELVIFTVIVVSVAILVRRHTTMSFWFVCLAAVLMTVTPVAKLAMRGHSMPLPSAKADGPLLPYLALSSEMNILHVMFDTLQTDVFERILADDGNLKAAFDGFTLHTDHAGYAHQTLSSLPSLLTGRHFFDHHHEPGANVISELRGWLRAHSIMTHLAGKGYEVSAVQPQEYLCRDMSFHCSAVSQLHTLDERKMDTPSLIVTDLVLLRIAPTFLKPLVYNRGRLLLPRLLSHRTNMGHQVLRSVRLGQALSTRMTVATDRPVYKFLHFYPPHASFFLDASCRAGPIRETTWPNYRQQATCSVRLFAKLLEHLKHLGVYDNTIVILQADTGAGMLETPVRDAEPVSSVIKLTPGQLIAYARPVLAIKGLGSRGPLAVSERPTSHLSTFGLIEAASDGRVDLPAVAENRVRHFIVSTGARLESTDVGPFESFAIEGPVREFANWRYEGLFTWHEQFPGAHGRRRN